MGILEDAYAPDPQQGSEGGGVLGSAYDSPAPESDFLTQLYGATPPAAQDTGDGREVSWSERIADFISDQLDPLNLALLAASVGGWSLAGKAAIKLGITGLAETGAATRLGTRLLKPNTAGRVIKRAAEGLGGAAPFALAEFIEEPKAGETRLGNFGRELLVLEALDLGLFIPLGGAVNRILGRNFTREATAASIRAAEGAAKAAGMGAPEARAHALASVIESHVKEAADKLGPGVAAKVLEQAERLGKLAPDELQAVLASSADALRLDPAVRGAMDRLGLPQEGLDPALRLLSDDARAAQQKAAAERAGRFQAAAEEIGWENILTEQGQQELAKRRIAAAKEGAEFDARRGSFLAEKGAKETQEEFARRMEEVFPLPERTRAGGPQEAPDIRTGSPALPIQGADAVDLSATAEEFLRANGSINLMSKARQADIARIRANPTLANRFSILLREMSGQSLPPPTDLHPVIESTISRLKSELGGAVPSGTIATVADPADSALPSLVDEVAGRASAPAAAAPPTSPAARILADAGLSVPTPEQPTLWLAESAETGSKVALADPSEAIRAEAAGATITPVSAPTAAEASMLATEALREAEEGAIEAVSKPLAETFARERRTASSAARLGMAAPPVKRSVEESAEAATNSSLDAAAAALHTEPPRAPVQMGLFDAAPRPIASPDIPTVAIGTDALGQPRVSAPSSPGLLRDAEAASLNRAYDDLDRAARQSPNPKGPCPNGDSR